MNMFFGNIIFANKKTYRILMFIPFYGAVLSLFILVISKYKENNDKFPYKMFFKSAFHMALYIIPIVALSQILTYYYFEYAIYFAIAIPFVSWLPANFTFIRIYKRENLHIIDEDVK